MQSETSSTDKITFDDLKKVVHKLKKNSYGKVCSDKIDYSVREKLIVSDSVTEKLFAKKPAGTNGDWYEFSINVCPTCGCYPLSPKDACCPKCKQRIDWRIKR